MTPIFREEKICGKLERVLCLDTLRVENFDKITLSRTVKEIQAVCVLLIKKIVNA